MLHCTYLSDQKTQDASNHGSKAAKEEPHRDLHAHCHEEQAHEQALVGCYVALHLQRKLCLCNEQTCLQDQSAVVSMNALVMMLASIAVRKSLGKLFAEACRSNFKEVVTRYVSP